MTIHFICTGNTFRSRLAEAYFKSKVKDRFNVFSSGVEADKYLNGSICWYTQRIIQKNNLIPHVSLMWQQTTEELLKKGDITIFMRNEHLQFCRKNLNYLSDKFEVWDVKDLIELTDELNRDGLLKDVWHMEEADKIFVDIKKKTDNLIKNLNNTKYKITK